VNDEKIALIAALCIAAVFIIALTLMFYFAFF
jgi:hypothetical protein